MSALTFTWGEQGWTTGVRCGLEGARDGFRQQAPKRVALEFVERDRVTISTQMAGRGTDIRLGEGVREVVPLPPDQANRAFVAALRADRGRLEPLVRGHAIYLDSEWALTSISRRASISCASRWARRRRPRSARPS